jgi:hypothetical protein
MNTLTEGASEVGITRILTPFHENSLELMPKHENCFITVVDERLIKCIQILIY